MALIDVIVPVYDVEKYLPKCVESLLAQEFDDYTVTLVDDGSPDGCPAICDEYAARYPGRVRVIHKENGGLSDARNAGVRASDGEYICFVDSDDHVAENHLSSLYAALADTGADMAVSPASREYPLSDGGFRYETPPVLDAALLTRGQALCELCYEAHFAGYAVGKLMRRELAAAHPFPPGRYYEDSFTVYRLVMDCETVAYTPRASYFYLQRSGSIQRRRFEKKHLDLIDAVTEMLDVFSARGMPSDVMTAGAYKVCRAVYITLFHAAELDRAAFREIYGELMPLLRKHLPAVMRSGRVTAKERLIFRLIRSCPGLFYAAARWKN